MKNFFSFVRYNNAEAKWYMPHNLLILQKMQNLHTLKKEKKFR